jgi:RNA polymerase sigma-70 factor (sigma-E family)
MSPEAKATEAVPRQPGSGLGSARSSAEVDFQEFVSSRGRSLLHSAYLLTGNLADAEDLVQSALANTYQAWDRIEDRRALDGYVRRAMVNTHISWWRRRKVDEYPTDDIPDQPVADPTANSELHDALQRAIDRLPLRMRTAVVLRFFEDMTEAEVADVLGVSQGTVKSTVSRAVAKLRGDAELFVDLRLRCNGPRLMTFWRGRGTIHPREISGALADMPAQSASIRRTQEVTRAQHDDGCPADRHENHAVWQHRVWRPGSGDLHYRREPPPDLRADRRAGGEAGARPACAWRRWRPEGRDADVEQRRAS